MRLATSCKLQGALVTLLAGLFGCSLNAGGAGDSGATSPATSPDGSAPLADGSPPDAFVGEGGLPADASADRSFPFDECTTPISDWLFCSGFEEANWHAVWDDYDGNPAPTNAVMVDPGPFDHPGNHVQRLRVTPGQRGGADLVKVIPPHDKLYARWYVAYEPGFNFDAPNHGSGIMAGNRNYLGQSGIRPTGSDFFQVTFDYTLGSQLYPHTWRSYVYYRGMYQDCVDPNGSCWGDSLPCEFDTGKTYCTNPVDLPVAPAPPTLVGGAWHCFEMMVDDGTPAASGAPADGGLDYWVDGQEIAPSQTHHWMRTTSSVVPDVLWISLFHHDGTHSDVGVYYDDIVVSTSRVGCR